MTEEPIQNRGSGTSVEDPFRLDAMHPVAGELFEMQIISNIFGEKDKDWFYHQRIPHSNHICEWQIRLNSDQTRSLFFDESRFTYSIPLPDRAREVLESAAARRPVPDATLISRFPLIEVGAKTAADAGRIVLTHINEARSQGWTRGNMYFFVDGWRFDQELFKGSEKTVMMFDMRPARAHLSNLTLFCALDSFEAIDQLERRMQTSNMPAAAIPLRVLLRNLFSKAVLKFAALIGAAAGAVVLFASHSIVDALVAAIIVPVVMCLWALVKVRDETWSASKFTQERADTRTGQEISDRIVQPDALLAAVIGPEARSRRRITEALWGYISQHGLQDQRDRTTIIADEKLLPIFGGKKAVTMFEMTKYVSKHLR